MIKDDKKIGFEIKISDSPEVTKSMQIALEDLKLDHLYIVNPSESFWHKSDIISVIGIKRINDLDI